MWRFLIVASIDHRQECGNFFLRFVAQAAARVIHATVSAMVGFTAPRRFGRTPGITGMVPLAAPEALRLK